MPSSVADLYVVLDSVTDPFSKGMRSAAADAEAESKRMSGAIGAIGKVALGVGLATIGIGVASVKAASEFQTQMTRLYTAAGAPKAAVLGATNAILQMGTQVGMTGTQMAEALYHPISAGLDMATSLQVVKYAAEEAQISGASLDDTTYSLSSVMKSFNQPASQAAQTMADLNAVVGDGDMRFQDFNESIKNWAPTAAQMGLSVDSMGAGLAYLTDRGNSAEVASTRLTMGISMMTTPTKQAAALLEGLGVASGDVSASSKAMTDILQATGVTQNQLAADLKKPDGLYVALNQLQTAMDKAGIHGTEADSMLSKLFGGGRSDKAVTALMQNLDGLRQKYDQITDDSTVKKFESNWEGAKSTFGFQVHQMEVGIENFGIRLGTKALPALTTFISSAEKDLAPFFGGVESGFSQLLSGFEGKTVQGPTVKTNFHNAHLNEDQLSQPAATAQITTMQKIGQAAKTAADDLARFGREGYEALEKIWQVARPLGASLAGDLAQGFKVVGWTLANIVGPALKFFGDFLASHQGMVKFFADVILGGLVAKMTILGSINAAKGVIGLATSILSFPMNQASAIGDAFSGLKTAVTGSEIKNGEQDVKGLANAFGDLKNVGSGVMAKIFPSTGGALYNLGAFQKATKDLEGDAEGAAGKLPSLAGGIGQVATAAEDAEGSAGSLMGTLGKFALGTGIVGAIVGGAALIGTSLGKMAGVGSHTSMTLDDMVQKLQLAAEGSTQSGQQIAAAAAMWVRSGSLGSAGVTQVDQALTQMVQNGHAADAQTEFNAISSALQSSGMSASDAAKYFPGYEQAIQNAGNAAQTMDGQVQGMLNTVAKQQALAQFQGDLQNVTQSLKDNGAALTGNSTAAMANQQAFGNAVTDIANFYQSQRNAGVGVLDATNQMDKQIGALEQTAIKAGMGKGAVDQYISTLLGIPLSRVTQIIANTDPAVRGVEALIKRINGSTATIQVYENSSGTVVAPGSGGRQARAQGGPVEANQTYWVGENGPELVTFGASGYVTPTSMLQPAVLAGAPGRGGGGAGGAMVVNNYYKVEVAGSIMSETQLLNKFRTVVLQFNGRNSANGLSLTTA